MTTQFTTTKTEKTTEKGHDLLSTGSITNRGKAKKQSHRYFTVYVFAYQVDVQMLDNSFHK